MTKPSVLPPSGFRDFTPEQAAARASFIEAIASTYRRYGFQQIFTSAMEHLSTLTGKGGGHDNEKLIFKILKRGEELEKSLAGEKEQLADMGMRFDLTLPLARYYARLQSELPRPFKVFHIGPVWRADRPQKGRFREFFQCDVDIIGAEQVGAEYECMRAILDVFEQFRLDGIELHINDRRLLSALGTKAQIEPSVWQEVLIALDKIDKLGVAKVKENLAVVLPPEQLLTLEEWILTEHTPDLALWKTNFGEAADSVVQLLSLFSENAKVVFNPALVRGQDYYTGTIFEIRHPDFSGSLAGGGRYNRLLEVFGAQSTPAFGGSIGFERLLMILTEQGKISVNSCIPQVFFPLFDESLRGEVVRLAGELREQGIRVDVFPEAAKLKQQFKYADDRKIPFVALLGQDELLKKEIKIKNMELRSEESIPLAHFTKKMESLCKT
jgi:histidyl-tRNA synthetase